MTGEDKAAKNIAVQLEGLANEAYGNGKTATIDIASAGTPPLRCIRVLSVKTVA
jgi:minor fimbrial subunit